MRTLARDAADKLRQVLHYLNHPTDNSIEYGTAYNLALDWRQTVQQLDRQVFLRFDEIQEDMFQDLTPEKKLHLLTVTREMEK